MTNQTFTGDFATVRDVLRQRASIFAAQGFELISSTIEGAANTLVYALFRFLNKRTGLEIRLSFSPAKPGLNGAFVAAISTSDGRRLNVKDFLKRHKRDDVTKHFTYSDAATDVGEFANSFLDTLGALFETDLKPILEGKIFEETPIDWGDYK